MDQTITPTEHAAEQARHHAPVTFKLDQACSSGRAPMNTVDSDTTQTAVDPDQEKLVEEDYHTRNARRRYGLRARPPVDYRDTRNYTPRKRRK